GEGLAPPPVFDLTGEARPQAEIPTAPSLLAPSLLADVPDAPETTGRTHAVRPATTTKTTEATGKEYEKVRRAKLGEQAAQRPWVRSPAGKRAAARRGAVAVVAGGLVYRHTRTVNQGRNLRDALGSAKKSLALDTAAGDKAALTALAQAIRMDDSSD